MLRTQFLNRLFFVVLFLTLMSSSSLAAGVLDKSFGNGGRASLGFPQSNFAGLRILIQPDNKILVVGIGNNSAYIGRYGENGSFDNAFNGGNARSLWAGFVRSVKLQPDNKILVSGNARLDAAPNSDYRSIVCRLNSDGTSDATFGTGGCSLFNRRVGIGDTENAADIEILPDGKILAIINTMVTELLRLNSNGTPDTTFGTDGYLNLNFSGSSLTPAANGKILFAGSSGIMRIDGNGIVDATFGNNGTAVGSAGVNQIVLQPDGKILAAGGQTRRFTADGQLDSSFPTGRGSLKIDVLPNGRIIILDRDTLFQNREVLYLLNNQNALLGRERADVSDEFYDVKSASNGKFYTVGNFTTLNRYASFTSIANPQADFDGDDKNDISVYRPSTGFFYFLKSRLGLQSYFSSVPVGTIIPEDFGGNSLNDIVWWTPFAQHSCYQGLYLGVEFGEQPCFVWGLPTDTPVGGDYDGDNKSDFAIFRQGIWHIRRSSSGAPIYFQWGAAGDKPVPADYDFDGKTDVAVYRPATGVWWVLRSSDGGYSGFQFDASEDKPVPADYDGDGRADYAVFRPSNGVWYLFQSTAGFSAAQFGYGTDKPVPGDYDGDGRIDIAVFRPSNGVWYLLQSTDGFRGVQLGQNGDVPLSTVYAAY